MKLVLQRVSRASVKVAGIEVSSIALGILILIGIEKADTPASVLEAASKVERLRLFEDTEGKTNLSIHGVKGSILLVPQFTLAADLTKGARPSFDSAESAARAKELIAIFTAFLKEQDIEVREGKFGERMEVELVNDGPATYLI